MTLRPLSLFLALALAGPVAQAQAPSVDAVVHPGAELVALGQWLSAAYPQPPDSDYKSDAWAQFASFRDHPGLALFREATLYPDFTETGLLLDLDAGTVIVPDSLSWYRFIARDTVAAMLHGLLDFARDADFAGFRERHASDYAEWEAEAARSLREGDDLQRLDAFFRYGDERARPDVLVILEPLNGWGAHAITAPPLLEPVGGAGTVVYQIGSSWAQPRFPDTRLSFARDDGSLAWHEASHVYLNTVLRVTRDEIDALAHLFDAENEALQRQNVTTWTYAFEENLVRAIVVVLTRQVSGDERVRRMVEREIANGFVHVGTMAALIEEEYVGTDRHATFDAFLPRVFEVLGTLP